MPDVIIKAGCFLSHFLGNAKIILRVGFDYTGLVRHDFIGFF